VGISKQETFLCEFLVSNKLESLVQAAVSCSVDGTHKSSGLVQCYGPCCLCHDFKVQWNLDLSFFKGMEKMNDECRKTISPGNYIH
jgi:hypothetical protein